MQPDIFLRPLCLCAGHRQKALPELSAGFSDTCVRLHNWIRSFHLHGLFARFLPSLPTSLLVPQWHPESPGPWSLAFCLWLWGPSVGCVHPRKSHAAHPSPCGLPSRSWLPLASAFFSYISNCVLLVLFPEFILLSLRGYLHASY